MFILTYIFPFESFAFSTFVCHSLYAFVLPTSIEVLEKSSIQVTNV